MFLGFVHRPSPAATRSDLDLLLCCQISGGPLTLTAATPSPSFPREGSREGVDRPSRKDPASLGPDIMVPRLPHSFQAV